MSFFDPQNPGLGGIDELTAAEQSFLTTFAGISFSNGDIIYYNSGQLQKLAIGAIGKVLKVSGANLPSWGDDTDTDTGITQLTGDVTTPSGSGSQVATLATVNSNVGSFGSATQASQVTVNGKGLVTAAANVTVTPNFASVLGGTSGSVMFSNGTNLAQDNANLFFDDTNNRLGINTASPSVSLHIGGTASRQYISLSSGNYANGTDPLVNSSLQMFDGTPLSTTTTFGFFPSYGSPARSVIVMGSPTRDGAFDFYSYRDFGGTNTYDLQLRTKASGNSATERFRLTGNADTAVAYFSNVYLGIGTTNAIRGLQVSGANYTAAAEIILENTSMAANNKRLNFWGDSTAGTSGRFYIRSLNDAGTASTKDFLTFDNALGNIGAQVLVPTATLHLKAGSATASTAPLKFSSGTLLTTAEAGAVEFLTDKWYGTITTSAVRKEMTLNDAALTPGIVPVATTNGRLTDSTLTATKITKPLFDHFADANNGTTVETDLYSDTIAAGQLGTNADKLTGQYAGIFVGDATSTQRLRAYFGGTLIFDSGALGVGVSTTYWDLWVTVIRVSASVVRCSATLNTSFASFSAYAMYTEVTGLTLANTQVLKITGTAAGVSGASNQITAKEGYVQYLPAA